ncbi:hypothetical protein QBC35DRAFT_56328 [Podospora australis]|uniref:Uncharacterized protein n=1 Tax=Podospora australis TaxID=1536484 RepID=A0AAN6WYV3_9PEZI|nr:hypothetical protein QBC35DRAFT_56328 [Podospora australis]
MQAVPSLVGTGTAIAAAAAGLVFGQPAEVEAPWSSPNHGGFPTDYDGFGEPSPLSPRPNTSATTPFHRSSSPLESFSYASFGAVVDSGPCSPSPTPPLESARASPRPGSAAQAPSPRTSSRRQSFLRQGDLSSQPIAENARDSASSRESWIKRFSLRPLSQNGSPRSSMGPDSSSMTFSHGSGVPMISQQATPVHAAPNKLVKRTTAGQAQHSGGHQRRGSKSQVLTLRRPATSHQRSATLQQNRPLTGLIDEPPASAGAGAKFSFEAQNVPASMTPTSPTFSNVKRLSGRWTSFFHARRAASLGRDTAGLSNGQSAKYASLFPRKRVSLMPGHISRAYLTKADCITDIPVVIEEEERFPPEWLEGGEIQEGSQRSSNPSDSAESMPERRPRRSMSMHFNAPSWIARTSSVRRPRRSTIDAKGGHGGRYATDAVGTARAPGSLPPASPTTGQIFTPPNYQPHSLQQSEAEAPTLNDPPRSRKRNTPSPLPPLSRLSSFNIDVSRLGVSSPTSAAPPRSFHTPINYMTNSQNPPSLTHSRGPSGERSITLAGSDFDVRDGDDDDTDFRSDAYDSFRTVASSSRVRSVETPLESMFDESPPSTASNGKNKRLSIQEILGRPWDGETKITEEDESVATPVRPRHLAEPARFGDHAGEASHFGYDAEPALLLVNRDFGRLSFDDDDDDDWMRDDDNTLSNHLSPPSSTNSRRVSPQLRHALRNIAASESPDPQRDSLGDRPRSNIFDWSEPAIHDKFDSDGPRPKTVHGKQEMGMDLRIGRSSSRKQAGAAHVRSQSVPVVPDPTDNSKPPPKFGTWGLGSKNASEDWDDDFDFDEIAIDSTGGKDSATSFMVPASIQATQPTVKAHSGQIRELSLLVNDLKRLCRHGKELDLLHGPTAAKFIEAENIIALASPDEDDADGFGSAKSSMDFDRSGTGDRFVDEGFDGSSLDTIDDAFQIPEPEMTRTTVVRERQSYRRRSVFSPDDDIFGNWPVSEEASRSSRPRTPESRSSPRSSAVIATVIEAMQQQRSNSANSNPVKPAPAPTQDSKLFFDTNSLQELVKRAGHLRDSLSDAVRRAELLTQSPAATPRRERHLRHNADGSPAFTRVFADPAAASPPRRLPKSHSTNSVLSRGSVDSPRMQMMIVS